MKNFWKKMTDINNLIDAVPTVKTGTMNEPSNRRQKQEKQKPFDQYKCNGK
jgi:hypothetical protein